MTVGILGGGAMGSGIAQVAAMAGHKVTLVDFLTCPHVNFYFFKYLINNVLGLF